jgi:hypothetical protein
MHSLNFVQTQHIRVAHQWMRFLDSPDEGIAFKTFLAWNDRAYGKPAQAVDVTDKEEGITTIIVDI